MALAIQKTLFATLAYATCALGVTITLMGGRGAGFPACQSSTIYVTCGDVAASQCCYIPGRGFGQALFDGLPTEDPVAYGAVYATSQVSDTGGCLGSSTDSGFGLNLCLGPGLGSEWFRINGKRDVTVPPPPVFPDALHIGNRTFNMYHEAVPADVAEEMAKFFEEADDTTDSEKIPEAFLPHERL